jgi:hypothetical protein
MQLTDCRVAADESDSTCHEPYGAGGAYDTCDLNEVRANRRSRTALLHDRTLCHPFFVSFGIARSPA